MLQKVILLTSWYPTVNMPQLGIFFKQQAEILSEKYDVKVVVCNTKALGKKDSITRLFSKKNDSNNYIVSSKFEVINLNIADYVFLNDKWRYNSLLTNTTRELKKTFTNWKPNIIHAHDAWLAGVVANKISLATNIPYVLTCHSPFSFNNSNKYIKALILDCITKTNQLITVSNQDKRIYESLVESTINPITIGNFIDTNIFKPNSTNNNNSTFKITQVTRTFKIKDIPTFLKAISYFVKNYNLIKAVEVTLILSHTNSGYSIDKIKNEASELGIDELLKIKSNIKNTEVAKELASSNVYISTSFYETFGVTIAEAIAMGIPTILVDNGASNDFVIDNKNALLVEMGDYKKIAENIYKIYAGEIVFDKDVMHQSIASKYSKEIYLTKLESIYTTVLTKHINNKN